MSTMGAKGHHTCKHSNLCKNPLHHLPVQVTGSAVCQAESVMTIKPQIAEYHLAATGDTNGVKMENGKTVLDCWQEIRVASIENLTACKSSTARHGTSLVRIPASTACTTFVVAQFQSHEPSGAMFCRLFCQDKWWVAPACRANPNGCIPTITSKVWFFSV